MNSAVASPAVLYPLPLPLDRDFKGELLTSYEASYAAAVAKELGVAAKGNVVQIGRYSVEITVWYNTFSESGRIALGCCQSDLRGWMRDWPLRQRVPVKPKTVAEHIRAMARLSDEHTTAANQRAQHKASNELLVARLESQPDPSGVQVRVAPSESASGQVLLTLPRQSFACTEEQAAAIIAALNAVPVAGVQRY